MQESTSILRRWRAERTRTSVHGGSDPTLADLILEFEETRIWNGEAEPDDAPEGEVLEGGGSVPRYRAKRTGDPVIDALEAALARGDEINWDLLEAAGTHG